MRNFKRALALVLAAILVVGTFATVSAAKADEGKWYQGAINYLHDIGVDSITPSQADMEITREQFVLWIAKIESHQLLDEAWSDKTNFEGKMPVDDIDDANYYAAIAYAFQSGFIKGEETEKVGDVQHYQFAPNRIITLGEVSAVIVRLMGYEGYMSVDSRVGENWAFNYVRAAQSYCNAFDTTFLENVPHYNPYRTLTYGEAAYIVATIMNQTDDDYDRFTADGIKLNAYFTETVNANALKEENYFVVSVDENGADLQNVKNGEIIDISKADFDKLVREALGMEKDAVLKEEDYPEVGALVTVATKAGTVVSISYEVTETFTTILNTYLTKGENGLEFATEFPEFYWSDIVEDKGVIVSARLHFAGEVYDINEYNSDIVFYRNSTKGEKMTPAEAVATIVPTTEGCVYAVFSAAAENVIYTTVINADDQEIKVIEKVLYDTVVIKDSNFVAFEEAIDVDENNMNFVVKVPEAVEGIGKEVVTTLHSAAIQTGYLDRVSAYVKEGYYHANIRLADGTLIEDVMIPMDKSHMTVSYDYEDTTYTYDLSDRFSLLTGDKDGYYYNGIGSVATETALWLNDRCVNFALSNDGKLVVALESAVPEDEKITTGFVASAVVNGGNNTYDVIIVETNENGVFGVVEYTVRARVSSMFDPANYKVYAKIWSNDLINIVDANAEIIPGNETEIEEYNHLRVEGQTDLIYVDVMADDLSNYLLCSTGDIKTSVSDDWKDIYEGHLLGEIEYMVEYEDIQFNDGINDKKIVYMATIRGYEPYYARTLNAEGVYEYNLTYERIEFTNEYKKISSELYIDWSEAKVNLTASVGGDNEFLYFDDLENPEDYTAENGWYVVDKDNVELIVGKDAEGNVQKIYPPKGVVLKVLSEIKFIKDASGEYEYKEFYTETIEAANKKTATLWNICVDDAAKAKQQIASELNAANVFDVVIKEEDIALDTVNLYPTIAFGNDKNGNKGVFIDIYENGEVYCVPEGNAYYTENTEVRFVVPTENGFTVIAKTLDELQGKGVFGVEWNTYVNDKFEITAIAIITRDVVFGEEGEILDVNTYDVTVDAELPEKPADQPPVVPPVVQPTYDIGEFDNYIELGAGQSVVYINESAHMVFDTITDTENGGIYGNDFWLDVVCVGASGLADGKLVDDIVYLEINMINGEDEALMSQIADKANAAIGTFIIVENNKNVTEGIEAVITDGKLNTKTAEIEIATIEGETKVLAKGMIEGKYVDTAALTTVFVTINNDGDLEVLEDATFEGMTTFDYIAINGTIYVIK